MSTTISNLCDKNGNQILIKDGGGIISDFTTAVQNAAAAYTGTLKGTATAASQATNDAKGNDINATYVKNVVPGLIVTPSATDVSLTNIAVKTTGAGTTTDERVTKSIPAATSSACGVVSVGNNITNTNGKISLSKANVLSALGVSSIGGWSTKTNKDGEYLSVDGGSEESPVTKQLRLYSIDLTQDAPSTANIAVVTVIGTSTNIENQGFVALFIKNAIDGISPPWAYLGSRDIGSGAIEFGADRNWKYDSTDGWYLQYTIADIGADETYTIIENFI